MSSTLSEVTLTAQAWEASWWASCNFNTFGEEAKQITYAHRMGLVNSPREGKWPVYDLDGKSVIDLGGGPVSMLLKTVNGGDLLVVDPCPYPQWTRDRYDAAGIRTWEMPAEEYLGTGFVSFDECWIYNVGVHMEEPQKLIDTARLHASTLRIFEWLETEPCEGHPTTLHAAELNEWIGQTGDVGYVDENGAVGLAYWGCFSQVQECGPSIDSPLEHDTCLDRGMGA